MGQYCLQDLRSFLTSSAHYELVAKLERNAEHMTSFPEAELHIAKGSIVV
jgi:hypothetical protein